MRVPAADLRGALASEPAPFVDQDRVCLRLATVDGKPRRPPETSHPVHSQPVFTRRQCHQRASDQDKRLTDRVVGRLGEDLLTTGAPSLNSSIRPCRHSV